MARGGFPVYCTRLFVLICLVIFSGSIAKAQITSINDATSTPVEGVGHDYIHMLSETVNPANGSVSLRIQVPVSKSRGVTIPFSFDYDSNSLHFLHPETEGQLLGRAEWIPNISFLSQGGWSYSAPTASMVFSYVQVYDASGNGGTGDNPQQYFNCLTYSNYMFLDPSGSQHSLGLGSQSSGVAPCPSGGSSTSVGGDPQVYGSLPNVQVDSAFNPQATPGFPLTVTAADGTVYYFPVTRLRKARVLVNPPRFPLG